MITVTLRQRPGANGKILLYLDYYPALWDPETKKNKRREYLHMSLYDNPRTFLQKEYNRKTLEMAEMIRCKRSIDISSDELGIYRESTRKASFIEFFDHIAENHRIVWKTASKRFKEFVGGKCTFGDINVKLCNDYRDWLMNEAMTMGVPSMYGHKKKLSQNTATQMYIIFRRVVHEAYKANKIKEDINKCLEHIPHRNTFRQYLTQDEVVKLWETPCLYGVLKDASMFSIFTGLRFGDILSLNWDEVQYAPDGKPCISKIFHKTQIASTVFISEEALRFCGPRRSGELVFKDLKPSMIQKPLRSWIKRSGIDKHITFHCFRHTNATLMLAGGADIYTVSAQLTHTSIKTTQIYGHLVDESKRKASEIITLKTKKDV